MSEQPSRSVFGWPLRFVGNVCATIASAGRLGEALVQRTLAQWRDSALRPSPPLVHVVPGASAGSMGIPPGAIETLTLEQSERFVAVAVASGTPSVEVTVGAGV